jgi:hypothetical protein
MAGGFFSLAGERLRRDTFLVLLLLLLLPCFAVLVLLLLCFAPPVVFLLLLLRAGSRLGFSTAHATDLLIYSAARLAAGIATCASRALGYEALCAVVPPRYYRQQRAQSTTHTSGLLEL